MKRQKSIDYFFDDSEWIIAVSRKFNDPEVDAKYFTHILPILNEEGIVLECSYASDDINSIDYWTTRMQIILEVSDFHIFVEHVTSPYTQAELEWSQQMTSSTIGQKLWLMFREEIKESAVSEILNMSNNKWALLVSPYLIRLSPHFHRTSFPPSKRTAELPFDGKNGVSDFESELRDILHEAKRRRRIELFDVYDLNPDFNWGAALNLKELVAANLALDNENAEYNNFIQAKQDTISDESARMHLFTHKASDLTIKSLQGDSDRLNEYAKLMGDVRRGMIADFEDKAPKYLGCPMIFPQIVFGFLEFIFRTIAGFHHLFRRLLRIFS